MLGDKRRLVVVMMAASLAWSLTMALPPLLGWGHYTPERNGMRFVIGPARTHSVITKPIGVD